MALPKHFVPGSRFGRLEVVGPAPNKGRMSCSWCRCDCGKMTRVRNSHLRTRGVGSCGCWRSERMTSKIACISRAVKHVRNGASGRSRIIPWELSDETVLGLIFQPCHWCGESASNTVSTRRKSQINRTLKFNGLDRMDNSRGYVEGNVVPCCKRCNWSKGTETPREFVERCVRVARKHAPASITAKQQGERE